MTAGTAERRRAQRYPFVVECSWTRGSRVTDISAEGCYVDSRSPPKQGAQVEFTVQFGGATVLLRGVATCVHPNIGFGVLFDVLSDEASVMIQDVLNRAAREGR